MNYQVRRRPFRPPNRRRRNLRSTSRRPELLTNWQESLWGYTSSLTSPTTQLTLWKSTWGLLQIWMSTSSEWSSRRRRRRMWNWRSNWRTQEESWRSWNQSRADLSSTDYDSNVERDENRPSITWCIVVQFLWNLNILNGQHLRATTNMYSIMKMKVILPACTTIITRSATSKAGSCSAWTASTPTSCSLGTTSRRCFRPRGAHPIGM